MLAGCDLRWGVYTLMRGWGLATLKCVYLFRTHFAVAGSVSSKISASVNSVSSFIMFVADGAVRRTSPISIHLCIVKTEQLNSKASLFFNLVFSLIAAFALSVSFILSIFGEHLCNAMLHCKLQTSKLKANYFLQNANF